MGKTESTLAEFALHYPTEKIPADVMHLAKRCVMNSCGVALVATLAAFHAATRGRRDALAVDAHLLVVIAVVTTNLATALGAGVATVGGRLTAVVVDRLSGDVAAIELVGRRIERACCTQIAVLRAVGDRVAIGIEVLPDGHVVAGQPLH